MYIHTLSLSFSSNLHPSFLLSVYLYSLLALLLLVPDNIQPPPLSAKPRLLYNRHLPTRTFDRSKYRTNHPPPPLPSKGKKYTIALPKTYHFETLHNGLAQPLPTPDNNANKTVELKKTKELLKAKKPAPDYSKARSKALPLPPPPSFNTPSKPILSPTASSSSPKLNAQDKKESSPLPRPTTPMPSTPRPFSKPTLKSPSEVDPTLPLLDQLQQDPQLGSLLISMNNITDSTIICQKEDKTVYSSSVVHSSCR